VHDRWKLCVVLAITHQPDVGQGPPPSRNRFSSVVPHPQLIEGERQEPNMLDMATIPMAAFTNSRIGEGHSRRCLAPTISSVSL
jgi:hypothetical protein